ncbi:hypothetical protein ISS21_01225 [Patescibacteria group bacterium]|nr:hypothetical protein [Patescibacteria group bacterium]
MSKANCIKLFYYLARDLFFISGACFLMLLILEDIQPGFVSFWFEIKNILIVVIISGLLALFTSFRKNDKIKV